MIDLFARNEYVETMVRSSGGATERHANGCMLESLRINEQRFGIDGQLRAVLYNTAVELELLKEEQ